LQNHIEKNKKKKEKGEEEREKIPFLKIYI